MKSNIKMKRISLIVFFLVGAISSYGQNVDSLMVLQHPLTNFQRDSLLVKMQRDIRILSIVVDDDTDIRSRVGRYKVYQTTNIYNSLKLDTASGKITALQIGINNDKGRFEYLVCDAVEEDPNRRIIGRYELHPTGNMYNFILIDTILGLSYQVQWSTKSAQCGIWRIW